MAASSAAGPTPARDEPPPAGTRASQDAHERGSAEIAPSQRDGQAQPCPARCEQSRDRTLRRPALYTAHRFGRCATARALQPLLTARVFLHFFHHVRTQDGRRPRVLVHRTTGERLGYAAKGNRAALTWASHTQPGAGRPAWHSVPLGVSSAAWRGVCSPVVVAGTGCGRRNGLGLSAATSIGQKACSTCAGSSPTADSSRTASRPDH
jgi:hypothetical protein